MIYLAVIVLTFLLSACASSTARISHAATSSAASVAVARQHLAAASVELDSIEEQANAVHDAIPFVSDDQNPIYSTMQYVSVAVVIGVLGALIYTYIPRGR